MSGKFVKIPESNLSQEQKNRIDFRRKRATIIGRILMSLGVMVSWVEVSEFKIEGDYEYHLCTKFVKWHPLFWVAVLISFVVKMVVDFCKNIYALFSSSKSDFWTTNRTQI